MTELSPMAVAILEDIVTEGRTTSAREVLNVLQDGAALAALGVTDDNQDAVEELHDYYSWLVAGL